MAAGTLTSRIKNILVTLAAVALSLLFAGWGLTSDSRLEELFRENQNDFNNLLTMAQQDTAVRVIRPGFTSGVPDGDKVFSQQRWNQYRKLFRKLGISDGLVHRDDFQGAIFFTADGQGIFVTNGLYKGYAYWEKPLSPVVNSLDSMPQNLYDKSGHAIAFKALGGNWYLYREEY